jgi:hypothetical protein
MTTLAETKSNGEKQKANSEKRKATALTAES